MSITKLSPNWACQMGPIYMYIHFINFCCLGSLDLFLFQRTTVLKAGLENLEQSLYLCKLIVWVLNFDYGIQLSIIGLHVSKYCLKLVTFIHRLSFYEVGD